MIMSAKKKKIKDKYISKRNMIWPDPSMADEISRILWEETVKKGFVNIPRTMPYILKIIDNLSKRNGGSPLSATYLSLWCRDFGTAFIEIKDIDELASEAGFSGSRAVTTLSSRIKALSNDGGIGFVRTHKGNTGKYRSILMLNPFLLIALHHRKGKVPDTEYNEICARCLDYGDTNLEKMDKADDQYFTAIENILNNKLQDC